MGKKKVFYYIYDKKLMEVSQNIPNVGRRAAVVQSLILSYNLLEKCEVCGSEEATEDDLLTFHSSDYIECLKKAETSSDLEKLTDLDEFNSFNLVYDCPLFENIYQFAKIIAGGTLGAAKKLVNKTNFQIQKKLQKDVIINPRPRSYLRFRNGCKLAVEKNSFEVSKNFSFDECGNDYKNSDKCNIDYENKLELNRKYEVTDVVIDSNIQPICINWFGGWHHAQRDEAEGFCYINDIVIGIQYLLKFYKKILYIDLDIHHGNGVENAFLFSQRVLTLSLHKFESGFYPSSGPLEDIGQGNGKFYTVNVPLKGGIRDENYVNIFSRITLKIKEKYKPQCVIVQCGADCLAGDPLGGFNLTPIGVGKCLRYVLDWKLPTLVLGGGGYNIPNVARCWAYLTSVVFDCPISTDIPDNSFFHLYGPEFELTVTPTLRKDENTEEYLETVVKRILQNLDNLP